MTQNGSNGTKAQNAYATSTVMAEESDGTSSTTVLALAEMIANTISHLSVAFLLLAQPGFRFVPSIRRQKFHPQCATTTNDVAADASTPVMSEEAMRLKEDLLALAESTNRGFEASREEKRKAKGLVEKLAKLNPTAEPAASYYDDGDKKSYDADGDNISKPDLAGKWTLIYTDAPDITSLDTSNNPLATSKLGRIGQQCAPPYIKNVIEWKRPDIAKSLPFELPFSGSEDDRVLQKVVTEASAKPSDPLTVDLKIAGLELVGDRADEDDDDNASILSRIQAGPAGIIGSTPLELRGFLTAPFGRFKVKYLDEEFRIIETYQGFLACNVRQMPGEEWF